MLTESFNYIVTVHNKDFILEKVLNELDICAGVSSRIYIVLDGCTDQSEAIALKFADESNKCVRILYAPDVHEIRSINIALREISSGFCVILQDDVILKEKDLEGRILRLCNETSKPLGFISFRLAADVRPTAFYDRTKISFWWGLGFLRGMVEDWRHVGHPLEELPVEKASYYAFQERMIGIKSPVCLTPELLKLEPLLDESLAPYCYDDVDLSLRALKHGLCNGLFPIPFESKIEWGGTRKDKNFISKAGQKIRLRNRQIIWKKHGKFIEQILENKRELWK